LAAFYETVRVYLLVTVCRFRHIHYLYTTINRIGKETIVILGVDKIDSAREILREDWIHMIEDEIYSL
jgi:hypothetical protein